jgi:hypothetical protein
MPAPILNYVIVYDFVKYKDTYTLTNNGDYVFSYTLNKVVCGQQESTVIFTASLNKTETKEFQILQDGEYFLTFTNGVNDATDSTFKTYKNLILSFVSEIENIFCGCSNCKNCEEEIQCNDYLKAFTLAQAIYALNYPKYEEYWNLLIDDSRCIFSEEAQCYLLREKVYGEASSIDLMLKVLSLYYLAIFYKDYHLADDESEHVYISGKYKFDKIKSCMIKKGITITDPSDLL